SSNVGVISSSRVEEPLICRSYDVHTPSCHVEGTTSTYQVGDIPSFASYCQGTSSLVQGPQNIQPYVDVQNVEGMEEIITPSRIHFKRPKYLIDIDTNILKSMPDKISKRTCQRKVNHMWRLFFEELNITGQCQLFVEMMRNLKFRPIMKILGLRTMDDSNERNIVKN
ncbi:hypothetical protein, partial [Klebsiella pneumoniae]|uniref:hypothetical protein n=1 Tax=Klebsiella pneumoniae TaxID=573 RepID=UPI0035318490